MPHQTTYLKDYRSPAYQIDTVELTFDLQPEKTLVSSRLSMRKTADEALILNGEQMKLLSVKVDGKDHPHEVDEKTLTLKGLPETFTLEIQNQINPKANSALDGLYMSEGMFCTQCEPQGFRRITYFLDRPDVMAVYKTKVIADKKAYPILLSNGNLIGKGDLDGGKHWAEWEDPFRKPCYLFALVAGDLGEIRDTFKTCTGRDIELVIYCDHGNEERCRHAMESLKRSMKWDEERFGLEYDLDIFMIVAVDAFNFGAMENKGLNIFNTSCILAHPKTETDTNFERVEGVIAHEYFHNWTGDRVTCRDWFQLTLKEGLTVYRDQEFSSDMNSRPVKRIEEVKILRSAQFTEDAGPTAHAIQPKSYVQINNFYTATVYNKGAEVIRMVETFVGREAFHKGVDRYFELFDGQAVTTDDFIEAMHQGSGMDFTQFKRWYHQAGTPNVTLQWEYNSEAKTFTLQVKQHTPPTADGSPKEDFHFPLLFELYDGQGKEIALDDALYPKRHAGRLLEIRDKEHTFIFTEVAEKPVLSINRDFSAPVKLHAPYTHDEFIFLMRHDTDAFNRFEAAQELMTRLILDRESMTPEIIESYREVLNDQSLDGSIKALMMSLPTEATLAGRQAVIDFDGNHAARKSVRDAIALGLKEDFIKILDNLKAPQEYRFDSKDVATRDLRQMALSYLAAADEAEGAKRALVQFSHANNMTEQFGALATLSKLDCNERTGALKAFYDQWKGDKLVMVKWLSVQAASPLIDTLEVVKALTQDPIYDLAIPNLVRALIGSFAENFVHFHKADGSGYKWVADQVIALDSKNPQIAARLCQGFRRYPKLDGNRKEKMKKVLEKILATEGLSSHVHEIVSKCLEAG